MYILLENSVIINNSETTERKTAMEVYVEYAFLENFLYDGVLLWLSLRASLTPVRVWKVAVSAAIGAIFALLYPLLTLPVFLLQMLKFAVGFLLCLLVMPGIKNKKDRGRYALNVIFFFVFSFGFGGVLRAVYGMGYAPPTYLVMIGFVVLAIVASLFVRYLYKKRTIYRFLNDCCLFYGKKELQTIGFLDSGNLASKGEVPVCFISPEVFYELFIEKRQGQVFDEMKIATVSGEKRVRLYKGEIQVEKVKKQVYFSLSPNMLSKEYKVLLNARIFE